jgi:hypothetical protein
VGEPLMNHLTLKNTWKNKPFFALNFNPTTRRMRRSSEAKKKKACFEADTEKKSIT